MEIGYNGKILLLFVALTLVDIIVIEFHYGPVGDWNELWRYHVIYWALQSGIPLLWAIKAKSWQPLRILPLWLFGLEDTAFYLLQWRIPEKFWGISMVGIWEPGWGWALAMNTTGLALFLLLDLVFQGKIIKIKQEIIAKKLKKYFL